MMTVALNNMKTVMYKQRQLTDKNLQTPKIGARENAPAAKKSQKWCQGKSPGSKTAKSGARGNPPAAK
jgi:hypothetical protein